MSLAWTEVRIRQNCRRKARGFDFTSCVVLIALIRRLSVSRDIFSRASDWRVDWNVEIVIAAFSTPCLLSSDGDDGALRARALILHPARVIIRNFNRSSSTGCGRARAWILCFSRVKYLFYIYTLSRARVRESRGWITRANYQQKHTPRVSARATVGRGMADIFRAAGKARKLNGAWEVSYIQDVS